MKIIFSIILMYTCISAQMKNSQILDQNQLIVYGISELKIQTDVAMFTFAVKGVGSSLSSAVNNAKNLVKNITNELKDIGLKDDDFSTSFFNSGENQGDKAFLSSTRDFKAEIRVNVTLESLNNLEKVIMTISNLKPSYISNVSFTLKDQSNYKIIALEDASKNAYKKASLLADQLKVKLGDPIYIEDLSSGGSFVIRNSSAMSVSYMISGEKPKRVGTAFYSPEVSIKSRVKIIYKLN